MRLKVMVYDDHENEDSPREYFVEADTYRDAMQIAFALDGGWGADRDATGMLPLAEMHCSVKKDDAA